MKKNGLLQFLAEHGFVDLSYRLGGFCAQFIAPFHWGYFKYFSYSRFLERSQWWPRETLEAYQITRLKAVCEHASRHVPYYRRLFAERGLKPEDFNTLKDLERIPVLTKECLVRDPQSFVAENIPLGRHKSRYKLVKTSGSTGRPLSVYRDRNTLYQIYAVKRWRNSLAGIGGRFRLIHAWSKPFLENGWDAAVWHEPYYAKLSLSTLPRDAGRFGDYLSVIKKFKPDFVCGAPSFLSALASYARKKGVFDTRFPVFLSYYENLYSFQKEIIQQQFGCDVFSCYATEEFELMAAECIHHEGMHIESRKGILEIVDDGGRHRSPGEKGRIVYSSFDNFVMPLIRYETGDIGSVARTRCSCGRVLPLLTALEGRTSEVISYRNKNIYPSVLSLALRGLENVKECQFVYKGEGLLRARVVKMDEGLFFDTARLIAQLKAVIGEDFVIQVDFAGSIARSAAGKFAFVSNESAREEGGRP
jgi:phenylacetate-CoA ligase